MALYSINDSQNVLGCLINNPLILLDDKYKLNKYDFRPNMLHLIVFVAINNLVNQGAKDISFFEIDQYIQQYKSQYEVFTDSNGIEFCKTIAELNKHKLIGGVSEEYKPLSHFYMRNHITSEKILLNTEQLQLKMNHISFMKDVGIKSNAIFPCWASLCKDELASGDIIRVLPDWIIYTGQIYLIAKNNPSPAEQLVIDFLVECCSEPTMEVYSNQI